MRLWFRILLCALFLAPAHASAADTADSQKLDYTFYTGGFKVVTAQLEITENAGNNYNLFMNARTAGWIDIFTTWNGTIHTRGNLSENGADPVYHESISVWPDNTQVKRFSWNQNGELDDLYLKEEGQTKTMKDIDSSMANNSVDILSAALSIMQNVSDTNKCGGEKAVFDGKRRFIMRAIDRGTEMLKSSRYNSFEGQARKCEIAIIPKEGDWHEKLRGWMSIQEQGSKAGAAPVVWLAKLDKDGPAVPVKMRAKTSHGTFMMHINNLSG